MAIYTREEAARIAACALAESMTPEERKARASAAGRAYWAKMSKRKRSLENKRRAKKRK